MDLVPFLREEIERVRNYVAKIRKVESVDFKLWQDEIGIYHAKFEYGRPGEGTIYHAVCEAIANVLLPLEDLY